MAYTDFSKKLLNYLKKEKNDVFTIYIYAILSGLVNLSIPLGIQAIVSYAFGATMVTSIYILIGFVTLGTWLVGFFQVRVMDILEKLQQKIFVEYAVAFAEKLPKLNLAKTNKYHLPELINRFFDTQSLQKGISKFLLELPVGIIQILFGLILLSFYHPYFIGFAIVVIASLFVLFLVTRDLGIKTSLAESDDKYEVASWLEDIARDVKTFKNSAFLETHLEETDQKLLSYVEQRTAHYKVLRFQYKTLIFFKVLITLFMLLLGTYLLINQKLNIGAFVATEIVILMIMSAVEKLVKSLEKYYDIVTSFTKLHKVLDLPEEEQGSLLISQEAGHLLEAKEISFGYDLDKPIINNLSVVFPQNKISLISGKQGSGKTLLFNLLAGFYQPDSGKIIINHHPIENYANNELRKSIGFYMDDLELIKGSVLQNINLGNQNISAKEINELAENLGITNFSSLFAEGLLTPIQAADQRLSYTTKKLILLLRAFVGEKKLLFLEDPLEGFNTEVRNKMLQFIKKVSTDKTIIMVGNSKDYDTVIDAKYELSEGTLIPK